MKNTICQGPSISRNDFNSSSFADLRQPGCHQHVIEVEKFQEASLAFGTMASRLAPVPEEQQTVDTPAEWLRKATILSRWQRIVALAMEFLTEYHERAHSDSTINSYSRPQAHTLGSWSSTLEPVNNHDDAMFDETHPTGHWHDEQTVRLCNWPERQQVPGEGFNLRQFFGEPHQWTSMVILYFLAHRHATEDEIKLYRSITLQFLVWSVVVSTSITQKRRTVKLAFLRGSFGPIWTFNLQGNFGPFFWPSQISNFWAIQFSG